MERRLVSEFEQTVHTLLAGLRADNVAIAVGIVELYLEIRGYGPVKEEAAAGIRPEIERRLGEFGRVTRQAA
jgi:indolepyruvate ferredoxin oxidoreductase